MSHAVESGGGRFRRSWRLLATSWRLVWRSAGLRNLALVSGAISCGVGMALFAAMSTLIALEQGAWIVVLSLVAWYPMTFLTVFLGVALVAAGHEAMEGREPSLADGFGVARARARDIAGWALLATGVGILLDQVIQRIPGAGRVAQLALGAAWAMVTLFAVPVIALEGCGARDCVRRSASVFRSRWGEGLVGSVSIWAALSVVTFPACFALGFSLSTLGSHPSLATVATLAGSATVVVIAGYAGVVMRDLYSLALYRYATEGAVVGGFREGDLVGGLKLKPRGVRLLSRLRRSEERPLDADQVRALPAELRARRICWAAVAGQVGGMVVIGNSEAAVVEIPACVVFIASILALPGGAAWGLVRLRSDRPRPIALWLVLLGGLGAPATFTWEAIGHQGNAYVMPLIFGMLTALAVLAASTLSPRRARRAP